MLSTTAKPTQPTSAQRAAATPPPSTSPSPESSFPPVSPYAAAAAVHIEEKAETERLNAKWRKRRQVLISVAQIMITVGIVLSITRIILAFETPQRVETDTILTTTEPAHTEAATATQQQQQYQVKA